MDFNSEAFLQELLETFRIEAKEHLQSLTTGLLKLEKTERGAQQPLIEGIFRDAHSLKGAARAVDMADIEQLCQAMEDVFACCKRGELTLTPNGFDVLHRTLDAVGDLVDSETGEGGAEITELIKQLQALERGELLEDASQLSEMPPPPPKPDAPAEQPPPPVAESPSPEEAPSPPPKPTPKKPIAKPVKKSAAEDTIRIATAKLDSLMLQVEEMLSVKLALHQQYTELRDMVTLLTVWKKMWEKVSPDVRELKKFATTAGVLPADVARTLERTLEFLAFNSGRLDAIDTTTGHVLQHVNDTGRSLETMVDSLLDDMKQILLHPFSLLLDMVPKMVRDLSRSQGKIVDLEIHGAGVEIDRRILEEMRSPFIHLIRNAIDHGIEKPDEREKKGKPRTGSINISIFQSDANKVKIVLSDDGKGIDVARVKQKAVQQGILTTAEAEVMEDEAAMMLIFHSALSTSPIITEISGRGLGMAIVQEKIHALDGQIAVVSTKNLGTVFEITLPISMATFRGILVQCGKIRVIVPTNSVHRVTRIRRADIKTVEGKDTIVIDGRVMPVVPLRAVLELPAGDSQTEQITVLVTHMGDEKIAFAVDRVLQEQEVLVKGLGPQLVRVRNITGATILGSGEVVPIVNVSDLFKSAVTLTGMHAKTQKPAEPTEPKSILVVDDSITSRSLLQNVLEAAGYRVTTNVDGVDAFTTLRQESFDLLVSDVEMPRMNGFELTAKVRADSRLANLPVILVTSLSSREDRERGIDVGADAYVVKSNFDQTSLLTIIERLIG